MNRNMAWKDEAALWQDVVIKSPKNREDIIIWEMHHLLVIYIPLSQEYPVKAVLKEGFKGGLDKHNKDIIA